MKVSCWCCAECTESRSMRLSRAEDSREVFLPEALSPESNHVAGEITPMNGQSSLDVVHLRVKGRSNAEVTDENSTSPVILDNNHVTYREISGLAESEENADSVAFDHAIHALSYHPLYLEAFINTHRYLMEGTGPLPFDYRWYIGIMAASRNHCSSLVNSLASEFLACGGDEQWLSGIDCVPKKLRNLSEVNKILAHQPWLLSKDHIKKLTKGSDNWSVSELTQALVLLAHYHSLSSFIFACGIRIEDNKKRVHLSSGSNDNHGSFDSSSDSDVEIEFLLEQMKQLRKQSCVEMTQEELLKRFDNIESQTAELTTKKKPQKDFNLLRFVEDPEFTFQDFAKRDPQIQTYIVHDYSWEDSGYSLASQLYMDVGSLLDDKFQVAQALTYYKMGHKQNVDTSTFRRAIWNYIHCLFGMFHDDYDYTEINQLLEKNLMHYIKAASCVPETITFKNYCSFMKEFFHSEKVHINIMILEARLQAELLYSLRAISRYMT